MLSLRSRLLCVFLYTPVLACRAPVRPPLCPERVEPYGWDRRAVDLAPCGVVLDDRGYVIWASKSWRDLDVQIGDRVIQGDFEKGGRVLLVRWIGSQEFGYSFDLSGIPK